MRSCLIYNGIFMPQSGVSLRGVATEDTCSVLSDSIAVHGTSQLMSIPIAHHDSSQEMENSGKKNVHFQINSNTKATPNPFPQPQWLRPSQILPVHDMSASIPPDEGRSLMLDLISHCLGLLCLEAASGALPFLYLLSSS